MKTPTLTDRVADTLIARIQKNCYPVGSNLPSGRILAQEFQVSPSVIREVMERLRTKGLVISRQGAGSQVVATSIDEGFLLRLPETIDQAALRPIYELRLDVEGGAAALAAIRATTQDIESMESILASLKKSLHVPEEALEWDLKFHKAMAAATHNPHYKQLLNYLTQQWRDSVKAARLNTLATEQAQQRESAESSSASLLQRVHHEHEAILTAIKTRSSDLARFEAQRHLSNACARLGLDISLLRS